ncbi:DUF4123 domain-containing protein [Hymenobacter sp. UYCo722]|uniref:DUF4123 domain-containing protein n=1 Tax=Hymenobacter sp. UYCo722 TaxID=3156335 RepID=UPI0033957636
MTYTYVILDGAKMLSLLATVQRLNNNYLSLYRGDKWGALSSVAPYIFCFQKETIFTKWLIKRGWGNSFGIFINSSATLQEIHRHFRKFLMVQTDTGKKLYFRFYDPRVLRIFLQNCDEAQLLSFFGPVSFFIMEDESPKQALVFSLRQGKLNCKVIVTETLFSNTSTIADN